MHRIPDPDPQLWVKIVSLGSLRKFSVLESNCMKASKNILIFFSHQQGSKNYHEYTECNDLVLMDFCLVRL
jgi:hypothetical protein